jgi:hypothetical protein
MTTIRVQYDVESDHFELWARDDTMRDMPAGPRLFRGAPYPEVQFAHETQGAAERDAAKLQEYLNRTAKGPTKKQLRQHVA